MIHPLIFFAMTTPQGDSTTQSTLGRTQAGLARELDAETRTRLGELPETVERTGSCAARNQALLQNDSGLPPFQALSDIHDETMNLAVTATETMAAAVKALVAMERALLAVNAQRVGLQQLRAEQRPWGRRRTDTQLVALDAFHVRLVGEYGTLSQRRDLLMATILQLMEQGAGLRLLLRRHYHGIAIRWQQERQEWLQLGTENWERALRGLPLRLLPPFTGETLAQRLTGIVLWYDPTQRRGVIKAVDGGAAIHVRRGALHNVAVLHAGQRVGFALRISDGFQWAEEVILLR